MTVKIRMSWKGDNGMKLFLEIFGIIFGIVSIVFAIYQFRDKKILWGFAGLTLAVYVFVLSIGLMMGYKS